MPDRRGQAWCPGGALQHQHKAAKGDRASNGVLGDVSNCTKAKTIWPRKSTQLKGMGASEADREQPRILRVLYMSLKSRVSHCDKLRYTNQKRQDCVKPHSPQPGPKRVSPKARGHQKTEGRSRSPGPPTQTSAAMLPSPRSCQTGDRGLTFAHRQPWLHPPHPARPTNRTTPSLPSGPVPSP